MLQRQWLRFGSLLTPMGLYMLLFFATPMLTMLLYSFWRVSGFLLVREFTLKNYVAVLANQTYLKLTIRSLQVGVGSALLSILIAYPLAFPQVTRMVTGRSSSDPVFRTEWAEFLQRFSDALATKRAGVSGRP